MNDNVPKRKKSLSNYDICPDSHLIVSFNSFFCGGVTFPSKLVWSLAGDGVAEADLEAAFKLADEDKSGAVDEHEFVKLVALIRQVFISRVLFFTFLFLFLEINSF